MQSGTFSRVPAGFFFPRTSCAVPKKHDENEPRVSDVGFCCIEMFLYAARRNTAVRRGLTDSNWLTKQSTNTH